MMSPTSRERSRSSREQGDPAIREIEQRSEDDFTLAQVKKMPGYSVTNREYISRHVGVVSMQGYTVVSRPVEPSAPVDYGMNVRKKRDHVTTLTRIANYRGGEFYRSPEWRKANFKQSKVVHFVKWEARGGELPESSMKKELHRALSVISEMRDEFQRDEELDAVERGVVASIMKTKPQETSEEEEELLSRARAKVRPTFSVFNVRFAPPPSPPPSSASLSRPAGTRK
jgi:hypothetical protein